MTATTQTQTNITDVMKQRKSVRKYKLGQKIPQQTLDNIFTLATTAPSSWNLQHWKFIVVQQQENKQRVYHAANNQKQVLDCSAVVIVVGDTQADKNAERIYGEAVTAGAMPQEVMNTIVKQIHDAYATVENIGVHEAIRNASFAAMQLMIAAKANGIDSCPMGGFDPVALRQELKIPDRYVPVLMITLGYGAEPAHPTFRFPLDEVVVQESFATK